METGKAVREVSGVRVRGWRVWTVRETRAGVRLCSVLHDTVWTPSAAAVSACAEEHPHEAPELSCTIRSMRSRTCVAGTNHERSAACSVR